jgi:hypothetical protein
MSPEKAHVVLLGLIMLSGIMLGCQIRARARFERWARAQRRRQQGAQRRLRLRQRCTQAAHERLASIVRALDLRVPKRRLASSGTHEVGWGTLMNEADTRVLGARETFPVLDVAPRRQ